MRVNKLLLAFFATLLCQGCATSRDVRLADGWLTHVVSCGGPLLDMGHCLEKAGEVCLGRGYSIIHKTGDESVEAAPENGKAMPPKAIPGGGWPKLPTTLEEWKQLKDRQLHIKCH